MKRERLLEFDVLRAIAFIFIVIQHTIGGFSYRDDIFMNEFFISKLIFSVAEIAVPLFLALTGVGLLYTYRDKLDVKDFYIKKLKFILLPFVVWSLVMIIYSGDGINNNTILQILSGGAQYHLWYMGMILRIYLYFPLIFYFYRWINNSEIKYIKFINLVVLGLLYYVVLGNYWVLDAASNALFENANDFQKKLVNVTPLFYYFYFVIGAYIISDYELFKKRIFKYKYVVIILYLVTLFYDYYLNISDKIGNPLPFIESSKIMGIAFRSMSILFFYLVSCYMTEKLKYAKKVLVFIGKYSFTAYLIHVFIVNDIACTIAITNRLSSYMNLFVRSVIVTILVSYLLGYIPFSKYIIGCKSKKGNLNLIKTCIKLKEFIINKIFKHV